MIFFFPLRYLLTVTTQYLQFVLIKMNVDNRRKLCYRAVWGVWGFFEGLVFGATTKKVSDPNVNYIGLRVFFFPTLLSLSKETENHVLEKQVSPMEVSSFKGGKFSSLIKMKDMLICRSTPVMFPQNLYLDAVCNSGTVY